MSLLGKHGEVSSRVRAERDVGERLHRQPGRYHGLSAKGWRSGAPVARTPVPRPVPRRRASRSALWVEASVNASAAQRIYTIAMVSGDEDQYTIDPVCVATFVIESGPRNSAGPEEAFGGR